MLTAARSHQHLNPPSRRIPPVGVRHALQSALRGWGGAIALVASLVWIGGCASGSNREPPNLQPHKEQVRRYFETGEYQRDVAAVAQEAAKWIQERAGRGGTRLAVVFDVDETLLSNWPLIRRQDFGYVKTEWQQWVDEGRAPAIEPVRDVFRAARSRAVEVVLLTGRRERDRAATARNLAAVGCADYVKLICKADDDQRTSVVFKSEARQELMREGWTIIANIGDQESDLSGGFAERTFKLPNPLYLTE